MYKIPAKTLFIGKNLDFLTSCHSTNQVAYDRIDNSPLPEGTVIITDNQLNGRGQMGNTWEAEAGKNLTFTLVLRPSFVRLENQFALTKVVSLGILDVLRSYKQGFSVKWPNDIMYYDKKVCGILIQNTLRQRQIDHSIIGIGLNVNQQAFSNPDAVSLYGITDEIQDRNNLFHKLCEAIEIQYMLLRKGNEKMLHTQYLNNLYRFGEDHIFRSNEVFTGRIVNVLPAGGLVIETKRGEKTFQFKEVQFV